MLFGYKCQPQNFHEKLHDVKCLAFIIKNLTEIVLLIAKCLELYIYRRLAFLLFFSYIKRARCLLLMAVIVSSI